MSFKMIDTFTWAAWVGVAGVEDHLGGLPQNPRLLIISAFSFCRQTANCIDQSEVY